MESEFRKLPSVEKLLSTDRLIQHRHIYPHDLMVNVTRQRIEAAKINIRNGKPAPTLDELVLDVSTQLDFLGHNNLRRVINATGVILHTNLGRAPLSSETIAAMANTSRGFNNLEFDLDSGTRGSRQIIIEPILCQLTGAEASLVVNNNAAAVLLGLSCLAKRKEIIVSRGQAVTIGGGFRIPDVMRQSGTKLIEVGTTNITNVTDFEQAINPSTVALMRVHSSNFKLIGFSSSCGIEELAALAGKNNVLLLDDLGSGCFLDTAQFGLDPEPTVQRSISAGVDLTFFSGDKLLGGPQAGIIVGKKFLIDKLKKHPLARAMRIDKIRLAGLTTTIIHYLKNEALVKIPVWQMISMPISAIEIRAKLWFESIGQIGEIIDGESMVGGGSLPGSTLKTKLLAIKSKTKDLHSLQQLATSLRKLETPIIARVSENTLLLDPRTVLPEDDEELVNGLKLLFAKKNDWIIR
jgi:L-seryl-tRNA(Ser) seleniumtransferase